MKRNRLSFQCGYAKVTLHRADQALRWPVSRHQHHGSVQHASACTLNLVRPSDMRVVHVECCHSISQCAVRVSKNNLS